MERVANRLRVAAVVVAAVLACAAAARAADGDRDPQFNAGSTVLTAVPGASQAAARAVVELPDGRLVVAGTAGDSGSFALALARYLENGTLDPTFGSGGIVKPDLGAVAAGPVGLVRRGNGSFVVAATALTGGSGDVLVARLDANGALDPTFGSAGKRVVDLGGDDRVGALILDAAQRAIVVGRGGASGQIAALRLDANGAPDASWSGDGVVLTDASGSGRVSAAYDVALQSDGKVVVVGEVDNGTDLDVALVRYDASGVPDPEFGDSGVVVTSLGTVKDSTNNDVARGVVLQPDGKIVAAGWRHERGFFRVALLRYDEGGVLDPGFGEGGVAMVGDGFGEGVIANDVLREPDGHLVTTGRYVSNQIASIGFPALTRFTADGVPDATFGEGGVAMVWRPNMLFAVDDMVAVLRDAHARFVTVGVAQDLPGATRPSSFTVARVLGAGACSAGPKVGCRGSLNPRQSVLLLRDPVAGEDRLLWQWRAGAATTLADFGNPVTRDDYTLCVFDGRGAPLISALAPAVDCRERPCWRLRGDGSGYAYRDPDGRDGLYTIALRPGASGETSIEILGRGERLGLPALPPELPLTVQLLGPANVCWEAVYEAPGVKRSGPRRFRARATD
jgi:uncharacterized delta-60 repeat protein